MEFAQAWLAEGPPYYGDSEFKHKGEMYKCGGRFDKEKKLWKAIDKDSFVNMVESGKWTPRGVDGSTAVRVIHLQRQQVQDAKSKKAYEEAAARNKKPVLTAKQMEEKARKEAGTPDDKPEELERLAANGITQEMVRKTFNWDRLGPKGGKSDALRVLCGLKWNLLTVGEVKTGVLNECRSTKNARRMREEREAKLGPEGKTTSIKKRKVVHVPDDNPKAPIDPYSREGAKLFFQHAAPEPEPIDEEAPRFYNHAPIKCVADTICTICEQPIGDQFLDCSCFEAVWVRCRKCGEKYRTDKDVGMFNLNKLCKCRGTGSKEKKTARAS